MLALSKLAAGKEQIGIRDVPEPKPGPGDVLLQVEASGICGTDMQIAKWAPRMARRIISPRVLGQRQAAWCWRSARTSRQVKVGDRISLESHIFCGTCHQCRTARSHLCVNTRYPGIDIDGAFARYVAVPECIAWVHPEEIPHQTAAMFEPFGIAVHACTLGRGVAGLPVLVNGCGPIGLMAVATAKALGAECVIAIDPIAKRRRWPSNSARRSPSTRQRRILSRR